MIANREMATLGASSLMTWAMALGIQCATFYMCNGRNLSTGLSSYSGSSALARLFGSVDIFLTAANKKHRVQSS